jgi:Leucine-rich repeat (LRR) protein
VNSESACTQNLPCLDSLNVENNNLSEIPAQLAAIPTLRTLLVAGNPQKGVQTVIIPLPFLAIVV